MDVQRIVAFSSKYNGGNPAGVVLCDELPTSAVMQAVAAEVGQAETVFCALAANGWRVRYFAPEIEIPFCGHATIAPGAALALSEDEGLFRLQPNDAAITVEGRIEGGKLTAALRSPPTGTARSRLQHSILTRPHPLEPWPAY